MYIEQQIQLMQEKYSARERKARARKKAKKIARIDTRPSIPNGVIVYRGPSMLDGSPIVCVITGIEKPSNNPKTGRMPQVWILPESIAPHIAVATRQDGGVCPSSCQQWQDGSCYVATFQGPRSVFEAMHRGNYPLITLEETKQLALLHNLRLGAWGDVSALPAEIALALCGPRRTGYSHGWRSVPLLRNYVMASADSLEDAREAQELGWRTFRVMKPGETLQENEILCPAESKGVTCFDCQLCQGASKRAKNVAIYVHGARKKRFKGKALAVVN